MRVTRLTAGALAGSARVVAAPVFNAAAALVAGGATCDAACTFNDGAAMPLTEDLISYWPLNEATGNALDAHGANDLTETSGTIASAPGKISTCRDFELGDTEYFAHADNADLRTGDIDFSWACWVNFESLVTQDIIAKDAGSGANREYSVGFLAGTNRFRFVVFDAATGLTATTALANNLGLPTVGTWYFIVAWHDASANTINIQVNDGTVDSASTSAGVRVSAAEFRFGSRGNSSVHLDGLLDEVGFWKRLLTSDEKTRLYNGGNGLAYPFGTGGAALTTGGATGAAACTFTAPVYTGTAAPATGAATCDAECTFTAQPVFLATANLTTGAVTAAASATFVAPIFTCSAALTTGAAICAAQNVDLPDPGGLCICDLTFTPTLDLNVAFADALNLTVDFTPPCDC